MKLFYTPFELISYGNTNPRKKLFRYPWGATGIGVHTSTESAVLSGLLEVMERDAISSMFFGATDIAVRRVDVKSIPEESQVLAAKIVESPYELIIIEVRTRFDMSVFAVYHTDKFLYPGGIEETYSIIQKQFLHLPVRITKDFLINLGTIHVQCFGRAMKELLSFMSVKKKTVILEWRLRIIRVVDLIWLFACIKQAGRYDAIQYNDNKQYIR
jgi:hypothetical protein